MRRAAAIALLVCAPAACDDSCDAREHAAVDAASDAGAPRTEEPPRPGDGCARAGAIDAVERDATCIVENPDGRDSPNALRWLTMSARFDSPVVVPGGTTNLRVAIVNGGAREIPLVLEARPPGAAGRPDWARLAGLPAPQGTMSEAYRASFAVRTVDARDFPVDRLPVLSPSTEPPVRYLRVRLAPGASLTWLTPWWALGIPAPYPPFKDDAGHRIVPQTAPRPLSAGEYTVKIEVPLFGLAANERTIHATVRVAVEDPR